MTATRTPPARFGEIAVVEADKCYESGINPRQAIDEEALEELTRSIKADGVREPLLVRPHPERPGAFQVADGARRLRAAHRANVGKVPVRVREMDDREFQRQVAIANLDRENLTPLEEAQAFADLVEEGRGTWGPVPVLSVPELAAQTGKSETYIYQRLKLRNLREEVQALLDDGTLPLGHALLVARVPADRQRDALLGGVFGVGSTTIRMDDGKKQIRSLIPRVFGGPRGELLRPAGALKHLRRWINEEIHLNLKAAPFPTDDGELVPAAGGCPSCPKRTGFQPALFPELTAGKDECTDRACFRTKTEAHVAHAIAQHRKEGVKLAKVTDEDVRRGAHAKRGEWKPASSTTKGAVQAVHVADGKAGKVEWVTLKRPARSARPKAKGKAPKATPEPQKIVPWQDPEVIADRVQLLMRTHVEGMPIEAGMVPLSLSEEILLAFGHALECGLESGGGLLRAFPDDQVTGLRLKLKGQLQHLFPASASSWDACWLELLADSGRLPGKFNGGMPADATAYRALPSVAVWILTEAPKFPELLQQAVAEVRVEAKAARAAAGEPAKVTKLTRKKKAMRGKR